MAFRYNCNLFKHTGDGGGGEINIIPSNALVLCLRTIASQRASKLLVSFNVDRRTKCRVWRKIVFEEKIKFNTMSILLRASHSPKTQAQVGLQSP